MIWKNPIFIRYCRSELRFGRALFWYLLTLIVAAFTVAINYAMVMRDLPAESAARSALFPLIVIQGIILLFLGTGSVANGITREKVEDVFNYQRLTPLHVRAKILGYLFGLPVREYVMFGLTLPFLLFVLIVGKIPPSVWAPFYAVFLTSAVLYHFTGMLAGMVGKWRWSGKLAQWLIVILYFVLPQFSHLGLLFTEYLTVRPTFREKVVPFLGDDLFQGAGQATLFSHSGDVPFFNFTLSGTLFSLLIQGGLILLFAFMVARKWRGDAVPAVGKIIALVTLGGFCLLTLGNTWTMLTGDRAMLPSLRLQGEQSALLMVSVLPMVLAGTSTVLALILMIGAVPGPVALRQGKIRAERLDLGKLRWVEDQSNGYPLVAGLIAMQTLLVGAGLYLLYRYGSFGIAGSSPWSGMAMLLASVLMLLYFQGLKELYGGRPLSIFILLHGIAPLLVAILIIAINQDYGELALLIAGVSPIAALPLAATLMPQVATSPDELEAARRAFILGVVLLVLVNSGIHFRLLRRKASAGIKNLQNSPEG